MGDDEAEHTGVPHERPEPGRLEHADLPVVPQQRLPLADADDWHPVRRRRFAARRPASAPTTGAQSGGGTGCTGAR